MMQALTKYAMTQLPKVTAKDILSSGPDWEPQLSDEQILALADVISRGLDRRFPKGLTARK